VRTIAVRGLDQQYVGALDDCRIPHDRTTGLPEIAGGDQSHRATRLPQGDFDDRRSEDVAGVAIHAFHGRVRRERLVIGDGMELPQGIPGFLHGVQRRGHPPRPATRLPLRAPRVDFLDVAAVGEHHPGQVDGGSGGVDRPGEALAHQPRQQPAVVDVRMRQQHEVERGRIEGKAPAVARRGFAPALEHAAIDQEPDLFGFDQNAGTGDLARRTEEAQFQRDARVVPRVAQAPFAPRKSLTAAIQASGCSSMMSCVPPCSAR
jgi:hypothetical protein